MPPPLLLPPFIHVLSHKSVQLSLTNVSASLYCAVWAKAEMGSLRLQCVVVNKIQLYHKWDFCENMKGFNNGGSHEATEDVGMWLGFSSHLHKNHNATRSTFQDWIVHHKSRLVRDFKFLLTYFISPQIMLPSFYLFLSFSFHQFVCCVVIHPPPSTSLVLKQLRHELVSVCTACAPCLCVVSINVCVSVYSLAVSVLGSIQHWHLQRTKANSKINPAAHTHNQTL